MRTVAAVLVVLATMTGCGSAQMAAIPAPPGPSAQATPTPSPESETTEPVVTPASEPTLAPPTCDDASGLTLRSGRVDAALGSRFLFIQVGNCSDAGLTLPDPILTGADADGLRGEVAHKAYGTPPMLAPGGWTTLELKWLSNGRCERGLQELRVTFGEETFDVTQDCMQLGGEFAPDREPTISLSWPA